MGTITNEMVYKSYEIAKKTYLNKISKEEGVKTLVEIGMNESSAKIQLNIYVHLIRGERYRRAQSLFSTDYFLKKIYEDDGIEYLKNAVQALEQHIIYYESLKNTRVIKNREILKKYQEIIKSDAFSSTLFPTEIVEQDIYLEGSTKQVFVNSYERNTTARKKCLEHHGYNCRVCNVNFEDIYGSIGKDFIHVHHIKDIATIGKEYAINPIADLIPVCPNCHAMLHKNKPAYTVEELKVLIGK